MRKILFVILAGSGLFATQAIAQDYGKVYIGLGVGKTTLKTNLEIGDPANVNLATKGQASTVNVFLGYTVNKNLSFEGGLTSTGQTTNNTESPDTTLKTETDFRSIELVAKGTLPLGKFELFARGGVIFGDTNYDMTLEIPDEVIPSIRNANKITQNSQKTGVILGAGAGYNFGRGAIRLQYDITQLDMKTSNNEQLYTSENGVFEEGTALTNVGTKNPKRLMLTVSAYF
jgi:hypothetical protein